MRLCYVLVKKIISFPETTVVELSRLLQFGDRPRVRASELLPHTFIVLI
jgi:hypothetical protein